MFQSLLTCLRVLVVLAGVEVGEDVRLLQAVQQRRLSLQAHQPAKHTPGDVPVAEITVFCVAYKLNTGIYIGVQAGVAVDDNASCLANYGNISILRVIARHVTHHTEYVDEGLAVN